MEVLGTDKQDSYIVKVSHTELEKVTGNYYGKLKHLEVGDKLDLGLGYKFTTDIQKACGEMSDAMKVFNTAQETMRSFALMFSALPPTE